MYTIKSGNQEFEVVPTNKSASEGTINGNEYTLDLVRNGEGMHFLHDNKSYNVTIVSADFDTKTFTVNVNGNNYAVEAKDRFDLLLKELGMESLAGSAINDLKAPMPGLVLSTNVSPGDEVKKGDALMVLEAMKMENVLKATADAKVKAIHAEIGKAVEKNQILIEFDA